MRRSGWITTAALLLAATACGGRLAPVAGGQDGGTSSEDASTGGGGPHDGAPDGAPTDERGPPPIPDCMGELSKCLPPEAGVEWTGAAVVQCRPAEYVGPWTLLLERLVGNTYQVVDVQVVQEPGFGATACETKLDDGCGVTLHCGSCANGMPCNPDNKTCCPMGFMSDDWGGCVCAPWDCPPWEWDTVDCRCHPGAG